MSCTMDDKPPSDSQEDAPPRQQQRQGEQDVESASSKQPDEDWFAWLQVLGAFCLNLNTWYVGLSGRC